MSASKTLKNTGTGKKVPFVPEVKVPDINRTPSKSKKLTPEDYDKIKEQLEDMAHHPYDYD